jgi:hypothetical protein
MGAIFPQVGQRLGQLEIEEHPGIAEGVGLHRLEVEELSDTGIVGAKELLIDICIYRSALDLDKAMSSKEFSLKGETENSLDTDFTGAFDNSLKNLVTDTLLMHALLNCNGTNFSEIFPQCMERTASDNFSI